MYLGPTCDNLLYVTSLGNAHRNSWSCTWRCSGLEGCKYINGGASHIRHSGGISNTCPSSTMPSALSESTSTATTTSSGPAHTGPVRSDEWHYIYTGFEGNNLTLTALQPWRNSNLSLSEQASVNLSNQTPEPLRNDTSPIADLEDMPARSQHWQFLEVPRSLQAADSIRMQIPDNFTLHWIAMRELGQNFRLTTDPNPRQEDFGMLPFGADILQDYPAYIGVVNDLNPAQWWFIGKRILGEEFEDGGFWITNVYARKARPNGEFLNWWLVTTNERRARQTIR